MKKKYNKKKKKLCKFVIFMSDISTENENKHKFVV